MRVSIELLQDAAFDIEGYIIKEFSYAFGVAEEQAFCVGTGVNQPTGIFTADGGEIGVTAGSATAVTIDDVINLVSWWNSLSGHGIHVSKHSLPSS